MAKGNMYGSFGSAAQDRPKDQEMIEAVAKGEPQVKLPKRGEGATTMTLTISAADKRQVKTYAARNCTTVSDLLHNWIVQYCTEDR